MSDCVSTEFNADTLNNFEQTQMDNFFPGQDISRDDLEASKQIAKYAFLRASHQNHQGVWALKEIRNWLLDGGHKMYKVTDEDTIENWLFSEGLPVSDEEDDENAIITFE
jgi:hypothetical protein